MICMLFFGLRCERIEEYAIENLTRLCFCNLLLLLIFQCVGNNFLAMVSALNLFFSRLGILAKK